MNFNAFVDRGEAANHGFIDASNLVKFFGEYKNRKQPLKEVIDSYEKEMIARNRTAVMLSRQACLDGHNWSAITKDSPLIDRSLKWMSELSL